MDLLAAANFSPDRHHRYSLCRSISLFGQRPLIACGFNPSLAAESNNDPTVRREIRLAERLECSHLIKINVFAAVSPYPDDLAVMDDPVGRDNDQAIDAAIELAISSGGLMLACWGTPKGRSATQRLALDRFAAVAARSERWHCLRVTQHGHPEHPLYLPNGLMPRIWPKYT